MSFILEALRKSEAERRRGQVPQLFDAPAPAVPPPAPPARVDWRWVVPSVFALSLALLWWRSTVPGEASGAAAPLTAASGTNAPPQQAASALRDVRPDFTQDASLPPGPIVETPEQPVASFPSTVEAPRPTVTAAPVRPAPAVVSTTPAPVTTAPAPIAGEPEPAQPRIASTAPPAPAAVSPAPAPSAAAPGEPMRLAELSTAERSALPPLRMSMHMWAPESGNRFVILDGTRIGEGDRVGSAVLEEITPDGAVLAWQGRRLKVPVR